MLQNGRWVWYALVILLLIPVLVAYILIKLNINTGIYIDFWGPYMAYAGTMILGAISLWQNHLATDISRKLFELEESKNYVMIDFSSYDTAKDGLEGIQIYFSDEGHIGYYIDENKSFVNYFDGDAWIFSAFNVTSNRIIGVSLTNFIFRHYYQNGEYDLFEPTNSCQIDNEYWDGMKRKVIYIAGIKYTERKVDTVLKELGQEEVLRKGYIENGHELSFDAICTNVYGEKYLQHINFNASFFDNSDIHFPAIVNKNYSKPIRVIEIAKKI